jgi:hypothetical protein
MNISVYHDEIVADIVISIMPVLALHVIMDGVQTALTVSLIICISIYIYIYIYIYMYAYII